MKYTPAQYALALYTALENKKGEERTHSLGNFLKLISRQKAGNLLRKILVQYEKVYLKKNNLRKIEVTTASKISSHTKSEIEKIFDSKTLIVEKTDPKLIAGITLLLDDSVFIDASARTRINSLFK